MTTVADLTKDQYNAVVATLAKVDELSPQDQESFWAAVDAEDNGALIREVDSMRKMAKSVNNTLAEFGATGFAFLSEEEAELTTYDEEGYVSTEPFNG